MFACHLEVGSIFTLEMLINTHGASDDSWSRIPDLDRDQLQSEWDSWVRDGTVLPQGRPKFYGVLITGENLYQIVEGSGEEEDDE